MALSIIYFLLIPMVTSISNFTANETFTSWSNKYHIKINNFTATVLESNFLNNSKFINQFNLQHEDFELGYNEFSHLSSDEFVEQYCGTRLPIGFIVDRPKLTKAHKYNEYEDNNLPESISWAKYMSPVRSQGSTCGSCWAFAVMGLVEMHNRILNNKWNHILAPQYLVDCDKKNKNCEGGWPTDALKFLKVKSHNEAPIESNYLYKGRNNRCEANKIPKVQLNIKSIFESDLDGNEKKLKLYLANYGPIVIVVNVDKTSKLFQNYKRGVFYDKNCYISDNKCKKINHAMLLIGYGVTNDNKRKPYYLIQNSWGTSWGEDGLIRMSMDRNNNCNIACYGIFIS